MINDIMTVEKQYLSKLEKTYEYLNKKYNDELEAIRRKIQAEKAYYSERHQLISTIFRLADYHYDSAIYTNYNIRGGPYRLLNEHCQNKLAKNVVMFNYEYNGAKYIFYLYDSNPLIYMNNRRIELEICEGLGPINALLKLLNGHAENYKKLNEHSAIFRWGSPEEHGLD